MTRLQRTIDTNHFLLQHFYHFFAMIFAFIYFVWSSPFNKILSGILNAFHCLLQLLTRLSLYKSSTLKVSLIPELLSKLKFKKNLDNKSHTKPVLPKYSGNSNVRICKTFKFNQICSRCAMSPFRVNSVYNHSSALRPY